MPAAAFVGRAHDGREAELLGAPNVLLLPSLDVGSDRLSGPFQRFGGDLQVGQELELGAPWSKGHLTADSGQHAPHAGREVCLVDAELHVGGELSVVACGA